MGRREGQEGFGYMRFGRLHVFGGGGSHFGEEMVVVLLVAEEEELLLEPLSPLPSLSFGLQSEELHAEGV